MRPPLNGMASRALTLRLTSASSSSDLSTRTAQVSLETSTWKSILTYIEPASTSRMACTVSAGLITVGLSGSVLIARFFQMVLQSLGVAADDHQEIVEVVRDAAGELADRVHLLQMRGL